MAPPQSLTLEQKIEIFDRIGEEILDKSDLAQVLSTNDSPSVYDGFEPSGRIHIAQGLLKAINVNRMANCGCRSLFYIADWFALLNKKCSGDIDKIRRLGEYFKQVWLAVGMNMDAVEFVWNSEFIAGDDDYWKRVISIARSFNVARAQRCSTALGRQESDDEPVAQILYPCMQAADVFELKVDICELGMDQRKVNMLARDYATKIKTTKPVVVSHHMLLGLIGGKMSKSIQGSAIFMDDSYDDIKNKIIGADCPSTVDNNPILEYYKYIIYGAKDVNLHGFDRDVFGLKTYEELETEFLAGRLSEAQIKNELVEGVNDLVRPVREKFETDPILKELQKFVIEMRLTR